MIDIRKMAVIINSWLVWLLLVVASCSDQDLEVRGSLDRLVGERVILDIVEGETAFAGEIKLTAADSAEYTATDLSAEMKDNKTLIFHIPTGIAAGQAQLAVDRSDNKSPFTFALNIQRAALALTQDGGVLLAPLPPSSNSPTPLAGVEEKIFRLALNASGRGLALAAQNRLIFRTLGDHWQMIFPPIELTETITALTALDDGLIACNASSLSYYKYKEQKVFEQRAAITGCRAIALAEQAQRVIVLHTCSNTANTQTDDCLSIIDLKDKIALSTEIAIESEEKATFVGLTHDGKLAIIPTSKHLVTVSLTGDPPQINHKAWTTPINPIALKRATLTSLPQSQFALADDEKPQIIIIDYNPEANDPLRLSKSVLITTSPSKIAFGRAGDLWILAENQIFYLDTSAQSMQLDNTNLRLETNCTFLTVQH